jgi:hypothetical protein
MVPASPSQSWKQGNLLAQSGGAPRFTADSSEGDTHRRSSFQVRCSSDSEAASTLDPLPAVLCPLTGVAGCGAASRSCPPPAGGGCRPARQTRCNDCPQGCRRRRWRPGTAASASGWCRPGTRLRCAGSTRNRPKNTALGHPSMFRPDRRPLQAWQPIVNPNERPRMRLKLRLALRKRWRRQENRARKVTDQLQYDHV